MINGRTGAWLMRGGVLLLAFSAPEHVGDDARENAARPMTTQNVKAAATSRLPALLEQGPLTGRGVLIAQWDQGAARASHADLLGRVALRDGATLSAHATHIAGTLIGTGALDPAARGMATEASLWSYRWDWDTLEERAVAPYVAVSAHAYGVALGWAPAGEGCDNGATFFGGGQREDHAFGEYGRSAAELDRMLHDTDAISVWAAGNERMDAGPAGDAPHYHYPDCATEHDDSHADEARLAYGTLGGPISAKNIIAVGAVADIEGELSSPELIVPLSFSSFGPTDDGRIKPDIAASGETLYSASSEADDAYDVFGGTSSAAAVVAGGVALLTERYRTQRDGRDPTAAEIKALLVHSAREAGAHDGPDYELGYGVLDLAAAGAVIDAGESALRAAVLDDGETIELLTAEIARGEPLRVTLAWLDPPALGSAATLVNDLDLALLAPDGETAFHPWRLDASEPARAAERDAPNRADTVERADVAASDNVWTGRWKVRVRARHALDRGAAQPFALAASVPLDPPPRPVLGSTRRLLVVLADGESTAEATLAIDNRGGGELTWTLSEDSSWLELSELTGTAPSRPVVRIDGSELAPGQHWATLQLRAGGTTRDIGVVVERACAEDCAPFTAPQCQPIDLGSMLGTSVAHGFTAAATVQAPSCAASNGTSAVLSWRAPYADTFEVALNESSSDALVYALDDGCEGTELACAAAGGEQRIALDLDEGERVSLVVDSPEEHSFALAIQSARGECFGQCGGTPDEGGCYCDAACVANGDCCEGACEACGRCDASRDPCVERDDGAACDDGDACTERDTCIGGACAGTPFDCEPASVAPDASMPDAASPFTEDEDAGIAVDAAVDAAAGPLPGSHGCGCRIAGDAAPSPNATALGVFALWVLIARLRARRLRSP